ncbi:MAG: cation diffusion facilitator family transporter [Chlamydiales bacterium]|jgi:cation diffusion facilitator family transporter
MEATPDSAPQRRHGERVHRINAGVNLALALLKGVGGFLAGSQALIADATHSLGDMATSAVAWLSFRVAGQPPDEDHHFGHGKAEAAASVFVGGFLVALGLMVLAGALDGEGVAYGAGAASVALGFAVLSMAGNLWLARLTSVAADEVGSAGLRALARDNQADVLSSALVIIGVLGGAVGWLWWEPIATAVIGLFIAWMGAQSLGEGMNTLMDRVTDPEIRGRIEAVAGAVEGVHGVQTVRVHPLGTAQRADVEVSVDGNLSVSVGHSIAHAVEAAIVAHEPGMVQISVHINPVED